MKRFWMTALLLAGLSAVLVAPAAARSSNEDNSGDDSMSDFQEDVNSALGSLSTRVAKLEAPIVVIHGFAELDNIFDDTNMGIGSETIGDNAQIPGEEAGAGALAQLHTPQYQMSPRNSRLDAMFLASVDGWLTKGYIEGDFLGTPNSAENKEYTQPTFRLRHAYGEVMKDGWDILAGQWWTLFGWNMDNVLATLDVSPIMGSLYERTERFGVTKTFSSSDMDFQLAVDAERPEEFISALPNFNAGIRLKLNSWKAQFAYATGSSKLVPLSVGISGRLATYSYLPAGAAAVTDITGHGVAVDAQVPLVPGSAQGDDCTLIANGEWMMGYGVADVLNGWNGGKATSPGSTNLGGSNDNALDQGIAGTVGATPVSLIEDQSFTAQVQFHLPPSVGTFFTAGYGETYSYNTRLMTGSIYNDVNGMFFNVAQDFTDNIRVGAEFSRFQDKYINADASWKSPVDHRVQLSTWYYF